MYRTDIDGIINASVFFLLIFLGLTPSKHTFQKNMNEWF